MIIVKELQKNFGKIDAVKNLSFRAEDGKITGIVGHNGAGKTTTFRCLAGVLQPDGGQILVDDWDVRTARIEVQRRIGVLPDAKGLYPRLTAREHIRYFARLYGLDDEEIEMREQILIDRLDMHGFADRRAKGFSKGQTRKVALARALVHEPKNLLLDEPTNGLDVGSSHAVHRLIHEWREQGRCVLFCSHIMQEVMAMADRIVVLSQGRVVAEGSPAELLRRTGETDPEKMFLALTGCAEVRSP